MRPKSDAPVHLWTAATGRPKLSLLKQRVKPLCCQISRKFMHPNGLDKQGVGIVFGLKLLHWNKKVFIRLSASEP